MDDQYVNSADTDTIRKVIRTLEMSKRQHKEGTATIISMFTMLDMRDNYNLTAKGYSGDKPYLEIPTPDLTHCRTADRKPRSFTFCKQQLGRLPVLKQALAELTMR
jgi:hypothetical protein